MASTPAPRTPTLSALLHSLLTGDSEDAKRLRQLENRLDKAIIKCSEAHHIRKTYEIILQKLQEERLGFDNEIATLEKAIKQRRSDFKDLDGMCNDAQLSRDMAKVSAGSCGPRSQARSGLVAVGHVHT